jgi:hypothetical protein
MMTPAWKERLSIAANILSAIAFTALILMCLFGALSVAYRMGHDIGLTECRPK